MKSIKQIIIGTPKGDIRVAVIKDGIPYDAVGQKIDLRAFKHNPKVLQKDFVDKSLDVEIPELLVK